MSELREQDTQRPDHYQLPGGVEVLDIIKAQLQQTDLPAFEAYCYGNALKYALRCGRKGPIDSDLRKMANYALLASGVDFREVLR